MISPYILNPTPANGSKALWNPVRFYIYEIRFTSEKKLVIWVIQHLYSDSVMQDIVYNLGVNTQRSAPRTHSVSPATWVLVGNPSASQHAYVDIYINGVKKNATPYDITPSGNIQPKFDGLVNGPVRVVSVSGSGTPSPINIFSSERTIAGGSFSEVMGIPLNQFTTDYWFTWVDKFNTNNMKTWILVGNPSSSQKAYVDIYVAGVKINATPYAIATNSNITPTFAATNGPVEVVSVTGSGTPTPLNIFTSERVLYGKSFNEMMGYPANQLTSEYWFTWYDSVSMKTDVLVGKP